MTDALDQAITSKRTELAEHDSKRERLVIELNALEFAASLRPVSALSDQSSAAAIAKRTSLSGASVTTSAEPVITRRGGKPKGAIAPKYRDLLKVAYQNGPLSPSYYEEIAKALGIEAGPLAVRDRLRSFLETGYLSGTFQDGLTVTELAAERFEFAKDKKASSDSLEEAP